MISLFLGPVRLRCRRDEKRGADLLDRAQSFVRSTGRAGRPPAAESLRPAAIPVASPGDVESPQDDDASRKLTFWCSCSAAIVFQRTDNVKNAWVT